MAYLLGTNFANSDGGNRQGALESKMSGNFKRPEITFGGLSGLKALSVQSFYIIVILWVI